MRPPEHDSGREPPAPAPEMDPVNHLAVAVGLIIVCLVFGAAVYVTWRFQRAVGGSPPFGAPARVSEPERGTVNQRLFDLERRARDDRQRQRDRLRGFGWVDRDAGVAHIPVDAAMELFLSRERDGGAP